MSVGSSSGARELFTRLDTGHRCNRSLGAVRGAGSRLTRTFPWAEPFCSIALLSLCAEINLQLGNFGSAKPLANFVVLLRRPFYLEHSLTGLRQR
jgi:hypothetical protein